MAEQISRRAFIRNLGIGAGAIGSGAVIGGGGMWHLLQWWYGVQRSSPQAPRSGVAVAPTSVTTASGIRIHYIQTGFVAVKSVHKTYDGPDGRGIPAIAMDRTWTEWLPITVWVIEHPEGVILIDTGEDPRVNDPDYFACDPNSAFFYNSFLRFTVTPEEAIDQQLAGLGIRPGDVRWVVQTHLHGDHVHGIQHFRDSEILISPIDYPDALGAVPCLYPDWLDPVPVTYTPDDVPVFGKSHAITRAGDVRIVHTPGHSPGHQSVILLDGDLTYFFAGDASFTEASMLVDETQGIAADPVSLRATTALIREYATTTPTVYLPSHDHDSPARLKEGRVVRV